MGYDFDKTHDAILSSAMKRFLEEDFQKASIRKICKDAGVTNGAFYAHFDSKDDLFRALADPVLNGLQELYTTEKALYADVHSSEEILSVMKKAFSSDQVMVHYVYEHADVFRLLLTAGNGTSYENFRENIVREEEQGTIAFLEQCRPYIGNPEHISNNIISQISSVIVSSVFDCFLTGKTEDETIRETQLASEFCLAGLKQILDL